MIRASVRNHVSTIPNGINGSKRWKCKASPVTVSPSSLNSLLLLVYENPTPTGDSRNSKLAATERACIYIGHNHHPCLFAN